MIAGRLAKISLIAASATLFASRVVAERPAKDLIWMYDEGDRSGKDYVQSTVARVANGILVVEDMLHDERRICVPSSILLTDAQLFAVFRDAAIKYDLIREQPYSVAIFTALERTFPCRHSN